MYPVRIQSSSRERLKMYNSDEVKNLLRSVVQPKLNYFNQELQEKQRIIRQLNERLNKNDIFLNQQRRELERLRVQQKQDMLSDGELSRLINKMINDKVKSHQEILSRQMHKIKNGVIDRVRENQKRVDNQVDKLKEIVAQAVEGYRSKSNSYWGSIKEALNKINSKVVKAQQYMDSMEKNYSVSEETSMIYGEFEKNKRFLKKFGEFKKSVWGIQKNYQDLLNLSAIAKDHQKNSETIPLQYSREDIRTKMQPSTTHLLNSNCSPIKPKPGSPIAEQPTIRNNGNWGRKRKEEVSIISINSSHNGFLHSTTLVNLSRENRREMSEDIRIRLQELVQVKNMIVPIPCYLDQINYLKNIDGNYIFDVKGNMFKLTPVSFRALCSEGLLTKGESLATSRQRSRSKLACK